MPEPEGSESERVQKLSNRTAMVVGFAVIALLLLLPIWGVRAAYRKWFAPVPSSFALSAYFVDPSDKAAEVSPSAPTAAHLHLRIQGDVYRQGQAVPSGRVRIYVATPDQKFEQSVSVPLVNGHFQADDPALNYIQPAMPVAITAEVAYGKVTETADIQLNSGSPETKNRLYVTLLSIVVAIGLWFVIAFTGRETARKKRAAIILSYCIIILFLAVPILLPSWLLRQFPGAVDQMVGEPAGLVVTCTSSQEPKQHQWALNIGGYSFIPRPVSVPAAPAGSPSFNGKTSPPNTKPAAVPAPAQPPAQTTAQPPSDTSSPTTPQAVIAALNPSPTSSAAPSPASASAGTPPASATSSPGLLDQFIPTASTPGDCREFPPTPAASPASLTSTPVIPSSPTSAPRLDGGPLAPPLVEVQGGLVVPLYVIILSVIGGAINMTRKVPGFQMEDEASQTVTLGNALGTAVGTLNHLSYLGSAVLEKTRVLMKESAPPEAATNDSETLSLAEQAKRLDERIGPLIADQQTRRRDSDEVRSLLQQFVDRMQDLYAAEDDNHPAPFRSYDEWFASHPGLREVLGGSWRVALLNQYMYLISAPFLAIVTYYLLDLLGLSKAGVVVVLSFSVGLISEKIVTWILGVATGYLRTPKSS